QNLAIGAGAVGSLQLTYISKVSIATPKQKPKTPFCFVINALSQRYFLQASDQKDLQDWVEALNRASKITNISSGLIPCPCPALPRALGSHPALGASVRWLFPAAGCPGCLPADGGCVLSLQDGEGSEVGTHPLLRRSQSYIPPSATKPPAGPAPLKSGFCVKQGNVRKSWKRRYFVLDEFSISYYKCEQDKEPLRSILLKDVCKTHECLVKSGDLLMRDNLFEIITSSRTFYIQADSPEEMHSWIRAITAAVQALKTRPREMSFMRSTSVARPGGSSGPSQARPSAEERRASCRAPSMSSWQPWTPVPRAQGQQPGLGALPAPLRDSSVLVPALTERQAGPGTRLRHRSEPQPLKEKPFAFDLDDESIRTSDV
ncbi:PKHA2 protein, partial [Emberiza fucata]|nr:PKHA2 protein [Emberiza fucata]